MMRAFLHFICGTCLLGKMAIGFADPIQEYDMKAAYLYNFAVFTEWPFPLVDKLNLCILGTDSFGTALDDINGRQVNGIRLNISHIFDISYINNCNMLYFGESERGNTNKILEQLGDNPILTVTDARGLAEDGVMIGVQVEKNRLVFDVNAGASQRARLILSSKLLRLARKIYSDKAE